MNREESQLAGFCDVKKKKKNVPRRFSGLNEQQSHQRKGQQISKIMSDSLAALAPAHSIWHTGSRTFSQHLLTFHPCLSSEWVIVYLALLYRAFPSSTCTYTHTDLFVVWWSQYYKVITQPKSDVFLCQVLHPLSSWVLGNKLSFKNRGGGEEQIQSVLALWE